MRRSEIESKYNQFVQVNEKLLKFINGEEGPDEDFEECQSTFTSLLGELLSGLTLYSGLSLFTPEQQEYIQAAKRRTFHPRHHRALTQARSRSVSRSRSQSRSLRSSISSESTSFQSSSSLTMPTPEEIAAAQAQKDAAAVAEVTHLLKVKMELEEMNDEAEMKQLELAHQAKLKRRAILKKALEDGLSSDKLPEFDFTTSGSSSIISPPSVSVPAFAAAPPFPAATVVSNPNLSQLSNGVFCSIT